MIARKGDLVAPTLGALMTLSYRDHNGNKKVYPTDVKNYKNEMPIHIVAMNKKCAQHIIQLLGLFHLLVLLFSQKELNNLVLKNSRELQATAYKNT